MTETVFVTGSTGATGQEVVRGLVELGVNVRAGYHTEANAEHARQLGAEAVQVDLCDVGSIEAALDGVDKAYSLSPIHPNLGEMGVNFVIAAKNAGLKHVVRASAIGADASEAITLGRWHRMAEKALEESGIPYTIVRPNAFMQNYINFTGNTIKDQNAFYFAHGEGKTAIIDVRDVAAVIVTALTEDGHESKAYDLTGPEALSNYEVAEILSKITGRTIKYVDIPGEAARQGMIDVGMPEVISEAIVELGDVIKAGYTSAISDTVQQVIGRPPISFEKFVADYKSYFI